MRYELRGDEMCWKRGVWLRATGIVPDKRITTPDVKHRPAMRMPGISMLPVQRAGYSGHAAKEIRIEGMEQAGELCELIRLLIRQPGTGGDGTVGALAPVMAGSVITDQKIPDDPVKIRQLPEMQRN